MSYLQGSTFQERYQGTQDLRMHRYEMMPMPLSEPLKHSLWLTVATTILFTIIYLLIPPSRIHNIYQGDFYILTFTLGWVNAVIDFYQWSATFFFIANLVSLGLSFFIIFLSAGLSLPILEPFHYMVVADAVPAGLSTVTLVLSTAIILAVLLLNLVAWMCVIAIGGAVLVGLTSRN